MKTSSFRLVSASLAFLACIVLGSLHASEISKADNSTALNLTAAWSGGVLPGSGDIALFDSTLTASRSPNIGADQSWLGIKVTNAASGSLQSIGATGGTLTLGTSGIDMSAATADLAIGAVMDLSASQSWTVASGRTLTVSGTGNTGAGTITLAGPGTFAVGTGIGISTFGTGTLNLGGGITLASSSASSRTINNSINLNGDIGVLMTGASSSVMTFNGNIALGSGTRVVSVSNPSGGAGNTTLTFAGGGLAGTNQITGSGVLDLENGNVSASPVVAVRFGVSASDYSIVQTDMTVGNGVSVSFGTANVFGSESDLTVNTGGVMNLSNNAGSSLSQTFKSLSGAGAVNNNTTGAGTAILTIDGGTSTATTTFSGVLQNTSGTGGKLSLVKSGSSTQVLSGANTYSGGTTINAGTLVAIGDTANVLLSTGAFTLAGGTFNYKSTNGNINSQTIGTVAVTTNANTIQSEETGAGSSTLTIGALTRSAGATINFVTTGAAATIKSTPAITLAKGVFYNGEYATATAGGTVGAINYGVTANTHSVSGAIGAPVIGDFYNLTGDASAVSGANFGAAGTIRFGGNYTFTATGANSVGGYLTNGATAAVISGTGTLRAGGEVVFAINGGNDTLTTNNAITQFNNTSNLANNTSVTKSGAGKLVLGGSNTYFGDTSVVQGTLQTTSANGGLGFGGTMAAISLGTGKTTVSAGATLDLSPASTMTVNEAITLKGGASLMNSGSGTTTIDNGVASVNLTALGSGGSANSGTVLIAGGTSNATASITVVSGAITAFTETAAGSGYTSTPNVTFTIAGQTTPSTATAVLSSLTLNGSNTIGGAGNITIKAVVANGTSSGGFSKTGNGNLTLSAANTYTGATTVTTGTLIVNGSIASSSGVSVGGSGTLKGSGTVSSISGAGLVSVGNSPGILTATQVDGSSGLDFTFEFTLAGSPTYSTATASGNDVLHLTNATPFVLALNSGNTLTVDFSGASLSQGQKYRGGFFTDKTDTSNTLINGATFSYTGIGGFSVQYNGLVTEASAAFASGTVTNGLVMEFEIVPEPSTWALLAFSLTTVMILRRRRSA